jgi:hypothetical protein
VGMVWGTYVLPEAFLKEVPENQWPRKLYPEGLGWAGQVALPACWCCLPPVSASLLAPEL